MDTKEYWKVKHDKYSLQDWIKKPTMFSGFAIKYFPKSGKLLDLGAGQGQDSRYFSEKGYQVTSTDFSDHALSISEELARQKELKITFLNVDLEKPLPLPKHSFDVIYSHMSVHYFSKKRTQKLFNEIANILKSGGVLALLVNTTTDPEVPLSEKIEEGLYKTPSGIVKRFFSPEDIKELTEKHFQTLVLDAKGETYKDEVKTLVRFIGKKV